MITLNTENGLVQVDKLEDITGRPGFLRRIDPNKDGHQLKALLGAYGFQEPVRCGLPCNQAHNKGFLAVTDKGAEILLGNVCGKSIFGVDFKIMRNRLIKDMASKHRREAIERAKHEAPMWRAKLAALRADGATDFYNLGQALLGSNASVPTSVASAVQTLLRTGRMLYRDPDLLRRWSASYMKSRTTGGKYHRTSKFKKSMGGWPGFLFFLSGTRPAQSPD